MLGVFSWLFANGATCGKMPPTSPVPGELGTCAHPSPFPCFVNLIYSVSFARDEKLGKSVWECVKAWTILVDQQLGH